MSVAIHARDYVHSRSNSTISKLERLNARVVKLLEEAVQEVLEVVKETVTEYQDKTARTHRENIRLRLRLEDALQKLEKEREVSKLASVSCRPSSQPAPISEPQDSPNLSRDSTEVQTDRPAVKHDKDPEEICDLKVAVTLADPDPDTPATTCTTNLDVKSEPVTSECSSGHLPPPIHPERQEHTIPQVVSTIPSTMRNHPATPMEPGVSPYARLEPRSAGNGWNAGPGSVTQQQNRDAEENHICFVCGKSFSRIGNLRTHQRCHTGEKPYRCVVCGRGFTQGGDLKKHERVHTGEKPYCCVVCGKSFSRGENLKRHQKIHMGEALYRQNLWKDIME